MIIGIDCDEPLADLMNELVAYHNATYNTSFAKEDHTTYDLHKTWGGLKEQVLPKIMDFYRSNHFKNVKPTEGSVKSVSQLKEKHDLFVITSRPQAMAVETKQWLEIHFSACFKGIHFSNELNRYFSVETKGVTKEALCRSLNIDLYIDDYIGFAEKIVATGIPVLLYTAPWNKDRELHPLMTRVDSWEDIASFIEKYENKVA